MKDIDLNNNIIIIVKVKFQFVVCFSGNDAKLYFEKLRKRYNKKKNDAKKTKKSKSSTRECEKAEKPLDVYKFLFWLDTFVYIKEGRSNVPVARDESSDDEEVLQELADKSDEESDFNDTDYDESLNISNIRPTNTSTQSTSSPLATKVQSKESNKRKVDDGPSTKKIVQSRNRRVS